MFLHSECQKIVLGFDGSDASFFCGTTVVNDAHGDTCNDATFTVASTEESTNPLHPGRQMVSRDLLEWTEYIKDWSHNFNWASCQQHLCSREHLYSDRSGFEQRLTKCQSTCDRYPNFHYKHTSGFPSQRLHAVDSAFHINKWYTCSLFNKECLLSDLLKQAGSRLAMFGYFATHQGGPPPYDGWNNLVSSYG